LALAAVVAGLPTVIVELNPGAATGTAVRFILDNSPILGIACLVVAILFGVLEFFRLNAHSQASAERHSRVEPRSEVHDKIREVLNAALDQIDGDDPELRQSIVLAYAKGVRNLADPGNGAIKWDLGRYRTYDDRTKVINSAVEEFKTLLTWQLPKLRYLSDMWAEVADRIEDIIEGDI